MTTACVRCLRGLGPSAALLKPSLPDTGVLAVNAPGLSLTALNRGLLPVTVPASLVLTPESTSMVPGSECDLSGVIADGVPPALGVRLVDVDVEAGASTRFPLMLMLTLTLSPLDKG